MTTTGLEVFDTTTQKTMRWLHEIDEETGWPEKERHHAYQALRACLHQIRDRLPVDEVAHFGAQLPLLVRGIYYEGWDPSHPPLGRGADDFINGFCQQVVWEHDYDYEAIVRACLDVLGRELDPGLVRHVIDVLPEPIGRLWLD